MAAIMPSMPQADKPPEAVHRKIGQSGARGGKTDPTAACDCRAMTYAAAVDGRPALIIGAGIAGPVMAIALARARIDSVVYEASVAPRDDAGVFFNLAPNGVAVLEALGVAEALEGLGFRNDRLAFVNDRNRSLAEIQSAASP